MNKVKECVELIEVATDAVIQYGRITQDRKKALDFFEKTLDFKSKLQPLIDLENKRQIALEAFYNLSKDEEIEEYLRQREERIKRENPGKEVTGRNREIFLDTTETLGMYPYKDDDK